jgi:hypothetical protein
MSGPGGVVNSEMTEHMDGSPEGGLENEVSQQVMQDQFANCEFDSERLKGLKGKRLRE